MRPVLHSDVVAAARVLLRLPDGCRRREMRRLLEQAAVADLYRKRLRQVHPQWGNGSLMAAAGARDMAPEKFLDDPDYCCCLMLVFEVLLDWRREREEINHSHKKCIKEWSDPALNV